MALEVLVNYSSIRSRVEALPEPDRSARLALHSRYEWETSWELNAWDHQRPPMHDDWQSWTVIGPRRTGSSYAGLRWMGDKLFHNTSDKLLVMLRYPQQLNDVYGFFRQNIIDFGGEEEYRISKNGDQALFKLSNGLQTLLIMPETKNSVDRLRGLHYDYVWADEIEDAEELVYTLRTTKQFLFTNPTKLPRETVLSRAGE